MSGAKDKSTSDKPQPMQRYSITGKLDLSQIEELDRSIPLRVAAVRDNQVLHSAVIHLQDQDDLRVNFELNYELPGRPCGVHLMVGRGDIPEANLPAVEGVRRWISASSWQEAKKTANSLTMKVGRLVIPNQLYHGWLILCRKYKIRGRVVCRKWRYDSIEQQWIFTDQPVPGATVEAFDVDRWWWWVFKDLIKTAVTDINGYFEMSFIWCCRPWFPFRWPRVVDPDLQDRIREILARARVPIGPLPPDPIPVDPLEFQDHLLEMAGQKVMPDLRTAGDPTPEPSIQAVPTSAHTLKALLPPAPELEALHIWPWWHRRDCAPDLTFRVTQVCEDAVHVIYEEDAGQTRWNIPQTLSVTLEANDEACCLPIQPDPPCGNCLVWTRVSCVDVDNIGTSAGPPDLRGYAYPNHLDRPFGGTLRIRGAFGEDAQDTIDYYRIEYHKEGMPAGTWIDMASVPGLLSGFVRKYWNWTSTSFVPVTFNPHDVDGKTVYMTRHKFERDNPGLPGDGYIWNDWDTLFIWRTHNLPQKDGLYTFRLVGYHQAADGSLVDERIMPLCGTEDHEFPLSATVMLRLDNRNVPHPPSTPTHPCGAGTVHTCTAEPDCDFVKIVKNEGQPSQNTIDPCDIVTIADSDTVTIHFMATTPPADTDAHLLAYRLTAHYGESAYFNVLAAGSLSGDPTPHVGPTYAHALAQGATRPHWSGGSYKVTLPGSAFPVSCAYQLRLRTWKRTTTGCINPYHFHWNVCEFSFCVVKPEK